MPTIHQCQGCGAKFRSKSAQLPEQFKCPKCEHPMGSAVAAAEVGGSSTMLWVGIGAATLLLIAGGVGVALLLGKSGEEDTPSVAANQLPNETESPGKKSLTKDGDGKANGGEAGVGNADGDTDEAFVGVDWVEPAETIARRAAKREELNQQKAKVLEEVAAAGQSLRQRKTVVTDAVAAAGESYQDRRDSRLGLRAEFLTAAGIQRRPVQTTDPPPALKSRKYEERITALRKLKARGLKSFVDPLLVMLKVEAHPGVQLPLIASLGLAADPKSLGALLDKTVQWEDARKKRFPGINNKLKKRWQEYCEKVKKAVSLAATRILTDGSNTEGVWQQRTAFSFLAMRGTPEQQKLARATVSKWLVVEAQRQGFPALEGIAELRATHGMDPEIARAGVAATVAALEVGSAQKGRDGITISLSTYKSDSAAACRAAACEAVATGVMDLAINDPRTGVTKGLVARSDPTATDLLKATDKATSLAVRHLSAKDGLAATKLALLVYKREPHPPVHTAAVESVRDSLTAGAVSQPGQAVTQGLAARDGVGADLVTATNAAVTLGARHLSVTKRFEAHDQLLAVFTSDPNATVRGVALDGIRRGLEFHTATNAIEAYPILTVVSKQSGEVGTVARETIKLLDPLPPRADEWVKYRDKVRIIPPGKVIELQKAGSTATAYSGTYDVSQVIDDYTLHIYTKLQGRDRRERIQVEGISTDGIVDDDELRGSIAIIGTVRYEAVNGSVKTILRAIPAETAALPITYRDYVQHVPPKDD